MAADTPRWRRRWLPPLMIVAGLVVLAGGVTLALTAENRVQRLIGWLLAASGTLNTVVAVYQQWWIWTSE
ncbi:MAG TPA: hypothetical protein VH016_21155 [Actinomycetota bacterium]|nr:hypothetical protein [Actinomycetota bacterium]